VDADAQEGTRPEVEDAVEEAGGTDASTVVELTQALMRQMVALAGAVADSSGLNPSDLAALRALDAAQAPGGVAVNRLGAALGLSSGAVTALVDRLERHGLAVRQPDPTDRRRTFVVLTPAAHNLGAVHLRPFGQRTRSAAAALTPAELAAVAGYLRAVLGQ
jgi:DNA-binding MarR family transcriptional regulator